MPQLKVSGDSVRSYLRDIGRVPLLEHDEEILLGRQVQRMMEIEETRDTCESCDGVKLTDKELAQELSIEYKDLRRELRDGKKAKEKMVTANLNLMLLMKHV